MNETVRRSTLTVCRYQDNIIYNYNQIIKVVEINEQKCMQENFGLNIKNHFLTVGYFRLFSKTDLRCLINWTN